MRLQSHLKHDNTAGRLFIIRFSTFKKRDCAQALHATLNRKDYVWLLDYKTYAVFDAYIYWFLHTDTVR